MSVIGGPNNPISNGLVYALDFKNNRSYVSGSTSARSLLFNPTTASISAGFDTLTNTLIFSGSQNGTTNLTFPQINYDKSFTISYVANIKSGGLGFGGNYTGSNTVLHTYFDSGSVRLGFYGAVTGFTGSYYTRTYPTSGNNQYTWVYTTGSLTLFVNGVPVSSSAANEGSTPYSGSDFKLSGRTSDNFWSGSLGNVFIYNRALTNDEIRANYTLASREYGLPTPPSFSIDENAFLFSQTAGITSSAYITALDTFVRGLKSASLWDKMVGIYPFLGGNNTLNQLNLKESSLTVYPASFTGSWSSSFSGSRSNTTASYATLTGLTPSTYHPLVNTQSFHMAYLSYDTPTTSGSLMGVSGSIATGGTIYDISGSRYHVFTVTGSSTFTVDTAPSAGTVQLLVVAGGGAGTNDRQGAGGAGGLVYSSSFAVTSKTTYSVTVGNGGQINQLNGQNSVFGTVTAIGGGGGGGNGFTGSVGGSGGGAGNTGATLTPTGANGIPGQGNRGGGSVYAGPYYGGGGGGGAGTSGSDGTGLKGGDGGSGSYIAYFAPVGGSPAGWFAGGGAGGAYGSAPSSANGVGGIGGGGNGGSGSGAQSGVANTGGGGGADGNYGPSGKGGSGIVIVGYPLPGATNIYVSPSDVLASINSDNTNGFFAGGPLGLVMTSRTGSRAYSVSKNKVIFNYTSSASSSISNNLLLNAVNVNGTASFPSQNNVAYASVGAGLTDSETRTYYDLVDAFQTNLGRKNFDTGSFITLWDTRLTGSGTSDSSSISLPLNGTQAITASWGDGTTSIISSSAQADRTHVYATPGRYLITITGSGQSFSFNNGGDKTKILDVVQWGKFPPPPLFSFFGVSNIVGTATDAPSGSATDLRYLFNNSSFRGFINNWDVSAATNMARAFESSPFNSPLDRWDVGNVTDFGAAFISSQFNQPIGTWNVSKGTSFQQMFQGSSFNNGGSPNINNWRFNTSSAINGTYLFSYSAFNQNIGSWNVEKFTGMTSMFTNTSFNNGGSSDINNWRPISCSDFSNMFQQAASFNQPIGNWSLSGSNINTSYMFYLATSFNQDLGSWDVSRVTNMKGLFLRSAFANSGSNSINNWRPISCSDFSEMFAYIPFNQPVGNWPISASNINMFQMFRGNTAFNQNIGSWDVSKVTTMSYMFESATSFNNSGSNTINNWRPISCSNFSNMFNGATSFNQPIGNWPLSASNINMQQMFNNANAFNQDLGSWDVSRVTNMNYLFAGGGFNNSGSTSINNWRPISCSAFNQTFAFCSFNQPIGNWPLSASNIDMSYMFIQNASFNQPLATWDTSRVVTMNNMFDYATAFNQDLGSWNVGRVTNFSNFMGTKSNYAYLHSIYNGWINNKLQPNVTAGFGTNKYSGSAAEGRALLTRTYNTASITGYSNDGGYMAVTCSVSHSVIVGNKIFMSGSSYSGINGVQTVLVVGSPTTLTLNTLYDPTATGGTAITGYGWSITDGGVV